LHSWDEADLFVVNDLSDVFAIILLKIFASMFIKEIGLYFSLFGGSFVWFWDESNIGLIK
jgi:hypothetical protein